MPPPPASCRRRLAHLASATRGRDASGATTSPTPHQSEDVSQPQQQRVAAAAPVLSDAEVREFHERGFIVCRGLIPRPMVDAMRTGYDAVTRGEVDSMPLRERTARDPAGEPLMRQMGNPFRNIEGWREIGYLERLVAIGKQLMGDDIEYSYDQLIFKPPGSTVELLYHQDAGYGWPGRANSRGMTSWLALSEAVKEQGSLWFVPGSHKQGIVEHYDCSEFNPVGGALQADVDPSAGVLVEYQPGDVTFHHGRTLHYSGGNHTADRPRCGLSTHLWPTPNDIEDPVEAEALAVLLRERSQNRRLWADRTVRG